MARTGQPALGLVNELLVHLDTHIVCWLYEGRTELLTPAALQLIETGLLQISPAMHLELTYLHERCQLKTAFNLFEISGDCPYTIIKSYSVVAEQV